MSDIKKLKGIINITCGRFKKSRIFSDFLELSAIKISNTFDPVHLAQRKEISDKISKAYSEKELAEMNGYFLELTKQIQNCSKIGCYEDIIGSLMDEFGLCVDGQDLTPRDIAELAARLTFRSIVIPPKGYIDIDEPTCGTGAMLISAAEQLWVSGINYSFKMVAQATDLDARCVHAAYIQFSLYGIPAVVIHGDVITLEEYTRWYTPMYVSGKWVWRRPFNFSGTQNEDDEMLKRMTEPTYDALYKLGIWGNKQRNNNHPCA